MELAGYGTPFFRNLNGLIAQRKGAGASSQLNNQNKGFMSSYAPQKMELTTRDLVSVAIEKEIAEGRGFGSGIHSYILLD